jgi:hypothetical protein
VSPYKYQRRRYVQNQLQGDLRKIKPSTFDRKRKMGEDVEDQLLSSNIEDKIDIYNLQEKTSIWWD